jgi:hypothetical protein
MLIRHIFLKYKRYKKLKLGRQKKIEYGHIDQKKSSVLMLAKIDILRQKALIKECHFIMINDLVHTCLAHYWMDIKFQ